MNSMHHHVMHVATRASICVHHHVMHSVRNVLNVWSTVSRKKMEVKSLCRNLVLTVIQLRVLDCTLRSYATGNRPNMLPVPLSVDLFSEGIETCAFRRLCLVWNEEWVRFKVFCVHCASYHRMINGPTRFCQFLYFS